MAVQSQTRTATVVQNFDDNIGVGAWSIPDGSNVGKVQSSGGISQRIRFTGYGFAIPSGASIKGYASKLRHEPSEESSDFVVYHDWAKLLVGGSTVGSPRTVPSHWPLAPTDSTFGSTTDQWGTTLTPTQVNDAGFGVDHAANIGSPEGKFGFARIISQEMTIYFEE